MRTIRILSALFPCAALLVCAGCYFHNTPLYPNPGGFHESSSSPFEEGGQTITGMASAGTKAVAVSYEGTIAYSEDSGVSWEKVPQENISGNFSGGINFNAITWGEGFFLAGGDLGKAAFSDDGLHWTAGVIGPMGPKNILCLAAGKVLGETVFAAAGTDGRMARAIGSPLGPWHMADQTPFGSVENQGEAVRSLAWGLIAGNGVFVAVGDNGKIAIMKDLSGKWYGARAGTGETFRSVAYGNDRFIAAGDNGILKFAHDPLGYQWHTVNEKNFELRPLRGIAFDPLTKHFVLYSGDMVFGFSEYGEVWTAAVFQGRFPSGVRALTCSAVRIILGSADGSIAYSN
jgi:hypothetical protein